MDRAKYQLVSDKFREFFLPTLFMTMANNLAIFVDSVLTSKFLGVDKIPAIEFCYPYVSLINMIYWMLGFGGMLLSSNALSDHDSEKADRIFIGTIFGILLSSLAAMAVCLIFRSQILSILCMDATFRPTVEPYYVMVVLGTPFISLLMCISYFARADGCPKLPFRAILIANIINLGMDCLLMKGAKLGLGGAALATIIGNVAGLLYIVIAYKRSKVRQLRLQPLFSWPVRQIAGDLKRICLKGFPTASFQLYSTVASQVLNNMVRHYAGKTGMEAYSIYQNTLYLTFILMIGTAQTLSPIVSVYAHEGDYDRARFILWRTLKIALGGMTCVGIFFFCFPHLLTDIFQAETAEQISCFATGIRICVFAFLGMTFTFVMTYYLQAIKHDRLSAVVTILESLILPVAVTLLLAPRLGITGVWISILFTESISSLIILAAMLRMRGKGMKLMLPSQAADGMYFLTAEAGKENSCTCVAEAVHLAEERWGKPSADRVGACVEIMLAGIHAVNAKGDGRERGKGSVDICLKEEGDAILLSFKDMGRVFDPTAFSENAASTAAATAAAAAGEDALTDSVNRLRELAEEIKYDRSLGMNATQIRVQCL